MLLKLYCLGAALASMSLPIQPQRPPHYVFFDGIPKNITNTTFPHNGENDDFKLYNQLEESQINSLIYKSRTLIWTPSVRKSSDRIQHNCGKLTANIDGTSDRNIQWIYNIMWKNASTLPMSATLKHTKTDIFNNHNKCNNGNEEVVILTKNKENGMIVKVNPQHSKIPM
uniref:Secreted protein n=1 Tax=Strongyloides venezuelensis TaxID=75913 RepID=A0A0K0EYV0_STRVS